MSQPDIFSYTDYRIWLNDWFSAREAAGEPVRLVDFAAVAGCSAAHVRNVLAGRRPLREQLVHGFCRALEIDGDAAERFVELVAIEETPEEDRAWALERLRRRPTPPPARADPLVGAVVAALRSAGVEVDARTLAVALRPAVPLSAAQDALAAPDPEIVTRRGAGVVEVSAERAEAITHLDAAIRHARGALVDLPLEENRHDVLTWAAPVDVRERWNEAVEAMLAEIRALAAEPAGERDPVVIYELLLQLFPLSETVPEEPDGLNDP